MKIKIGFTLALLFGWGFLNRGIFYPVDVIAKNTLTVSTVNGGDAAFVAQTAYSTGSTSIAAFSSLALLSLLAVVWASELKKLFQSN